MEPQLAFCLAVYTLGALYLRIFGLSPKGTR
jgi:hypothetical protein